MGTLLTSNTVVVAGARHPSQHAFVLCFAVGGAAALLAAALTAFTPRRRAAAPAAAPHVGTEEVASTV
jgi:hypothetical protein